MGKFSGKIVLITGASSGIGAALARAFAAEGASLALTARRTDRLRTIAAEISTRLPAVKVEVYGCDVSTAGDLDAVVAQIRNAFGRLDVVVANAGFGVVGDFDQLSIADYDRQFQTNIYGVLRTAKATLEDLKKSGGSLAIVGSVNGYVALAGNSPYAMSKFAVRALAESLWGELGPLGVSVTHVAPGFVQSEIRQVDNTGVWHPNAKDRVPAWLQMSASTAATRIVSAIARRRREIVLTGHGKLAVWWKRYFPGLLFSMMRLLKVSARKEARK